MPAPAARATPCPPWRSLRGSRFADTLVGDGAPNRLAGGDGNDVLQGRGGTDVLRGEAGADTASYAERGSSGPVVVTLDGVPNDGAAGENDDVGGDIENVAGGAGPDRLTGGNGANVLTGGDGADVLTGGGAIDGFAAGAGNDTVRALDANAERVDCGSGAGDLAEADPTDQLLGCETSSIAKLGIDADGDGFPLGPGQDCDDTNPSVNPGAVDKPGNGVDEDCRDGDSPFPLLGASVVVRWAVFESHTRLLRVRVEGLAAANASVCAARAADVRSRRSPSRRAKPAGRR